MESADRTIELAALSADLPATIELTRAALEAAYRRSGQLAEAEERIAHLTARLRSGELTEGLVARDGGRSAGIALWDTGHPAGVTVQTLYWRGADGTPPRYGEFLDILRARVGPMVFLPGGLVGLTEGEESALMGERGYARFARSEMRWPAGRTPPPEAPPSGVTIRPVGVGEQATVARLHRAAFDGTFDQQMYLVDRDPAVDSARGVADMMGGLYGPLLANASTLAEIDGHPVGASLVVRSGHGPLLISVMVERAHQGRGIGRALVIANLRRLAEHGEPSAILNVTEGNDRAVHLYEHLGFVRSIGPEHSWYLRATLGVGPGDVAR
jgi:GNAT superfamily N-acetyltransferase